jgi:TPR repeat protein
VKKLFVWTLFTSFALCTLAADNRSMVNTGYARAARFMSAAEKGEAIARFELGMLHEKGEVVPQSHKEAAKWFRLAAYDGYAPAQMFLGLLYLSNKATQANPTEAVKYLTLAAEQDYADAQFILGGIYFGDTVVPHDYVQAYKWFRIAAAKGNGASENPIDQVAKRMTPQQVAEAERLAEEFTKNRKK